MRIIVPLQGVLHGHGGIVLGSIIPCALFYFLQFHLKRHQKPPSSPPAPPEIQRSSSRAALISPSTTLPSSRATAIINSPDSPYYIGLTKCLEDPYDPISNPDGIIQLGLAENQLTLDLLREWLEGNLEESMMDENHKDLDLGRLVTYPPSDGLMELKIAMAGFMGQIMGGLVSFKPSQIILTAGASPAIETLSFCVADPGNAFLVPSPYYPGFDRDIKLRTGVELIPVPCRSTDNFSLTIDALERAYIQAKKRGVKVRAVLITNPSNPVGNLLKRETLYELLDFVTAKNIHLISDEIYAGSTYGSDKFVSVAEVLHAENFDRGRVHLIYGLSKDLSLPGFRVGLIYSYNEEVLTAARKLSRFSSISVPTQRLLVAMLSNRKFVSKYLETNVERLQKMYALFIDGMKQLGIECANSSGGFYCWADMSKFIRPYNEKGELELWDKLLNVAKISMTPGSACHSIEPGWFRCCFTGLAESDIPIVMERIRKITGRHNFHS